MKRKKLFITILIIIIFGSFFSFRYEIKKFTYEKWRNEPQKRYLIVENMLKKHDLKKMTKKQVYDLLGQPEDPGCLAGRAIRRDTKSVVLPCTERIFYYTKKGQSPEEYEGFYVEFDFNGKVIDHAVIYFTT